MVRRSKLAAQGPRTRAGKEITRTNRETKHDWDELRRAFIEGLPTPGTKNERWWPTLKQMSEDYDISYEYLRKRASQERWSAKKEAAEMLAIQERAKKRAKQIANNAMDFDEKSHNVAKIGLAMVTARLAEVANEVQTKKPLRDDAMQRLARGEHVDPKELYSAIRFAEMDGLASAASKFQDIGRKALGTDVQRVDVMGIGGDTTVNVVNVSQEMRRDDPDRMAKMLEAMAESKLLPEELLKSLGGKPAKVAGEIIDGETVEEPEVVHMPNDMVDADVSEDDGDEDFDENISDPDDGDGDDSDLPEDCIEHDWDEDREDMAVCVHCGRTEPWEDDTDDDLIDDTLDLDGVDLP